ncbi:MAG: molecular chaperone DnaJ [Corynebacterium sp.]|uniref:molecular chaperone DnaJ n=1 Tax=unclassified Corynebacterium TaxID=2624378 RepID=UPI0026497E1C|nr:molecular chaperone DnaJ [Corynebacterium sp.]MDN5581889.1 molecular chaperone DnaJ [Corynebacterium sp.]MDN5719091.1 molecular chaperone DnaJ [Corynebacterium sp.]MDN6259314.1 molecular chaperone DnaJ [Corynebacterium sp.]MDN6324904.1 molecular chaperone DnaJ [Corynebacterium sp.]MDN6386913.1 molecular chaperone DnaJ [Corynebacterium sp.]
MAQKEWIDKDYYADLGVSSTAEADEIKKAYRKLARENHPDAHPGDTAAENRFKTASEAYSVLGDKDKRAEYDELKQMVASGGYGAPGGGYGTPGGTSGGFGGFGGGAGGTGGFDLGDLFNRAGGSGGGAGGFGDVFGDMFGGGSGGGGGGRTQRRTRGADVETEITLDFREATKGVTVPIRLTSPAACTTCHGSGATPGTSSARCGTCSGAGVVSENRGAFGFSRPCPDCNGTGTRIEDPCADCSGSGRVTRTRTITVRVPAGVVDGQKVRLAGQGEAGERGRPSGDLFVTVHVRADKLFTRNGDDLKMTVPVSFTELALGGAVTVPTLDTRVRVKIPAGTADGTTLRVRGRGVTKRNGASGDLLVTVKVAVPKNLDEGAASALRHYAEEEKRTGFDPRAGWSGN